jgi:hypothetical protein
VTNIPDLLLWFFWNNILGIHDFNSIRGSGYGNRNRDLQDRTIPYRTVPYRTVPYRTVPHRISPYRTVPYRTVPYRPVPYRTYKWSVNVELGVVPVVA